MVDIKKLLLKMLFFMGVIYIVEGFNLNRGLNAPVTPIGIFGVVLVIFCFVFLVIKRGDNMTGSESYKMGNGLCIGTKDKCLVIQFDKIYGEVDIPLSEISEDSELWKKSQVDEEGEVVISEWFAEKRGWIK